MGSPYLLKTRGIFYSLFSFCPLNHEHRNRLDVIGVIIGPNIGPGVWMSRQWTEASDQSLALQLVLTVVLWALAVPDNTNSPTCFIFDIVNVCRYRNSGWIRGLYLAQGAWRIQNFIHWSPYTILMSNITGINRIFRRVKKLLYFSRLAIKKCVLVCFLLVDAVCKEIHRVIWKPLYYCRLEPFLRNVAVLIIKNLNCPLTGC